MIAFIKGRVVATTENSVILENGGIGYNIFVSGATLIELEILEGEVILYTHMNVREDDISLFGFLSMEEMDMFTMLISVSGIGAKIALGILGTMSPSTIITAVLNEDHAMLGTAPGIGKKTAQRMVLDLRDKISKNSMSSGVIPKGTLASGNSNGIKTSAKQDAIEALLSLGYNKNESISVVMEVATEDANTEDIIKMALKKFLK